MRIFIGREDALEALQSDLLGPSRYTIANLHGIGGVGKTTLKAEVLLRLQEGGARIPVFHGDENLARSDLGEFLSALADSLHSPWEGEPTDFARVRRARHRLRELKGRLTRERDAALLDRGLKVALSGLARRALLAKAPPDLPATGSSLPGNPVLTATVPAPAPLPPGAGGTATLQVGPDHGTGAARSVTAMLPAASPAGFTFQAVTDSWTRSDQQDYEQAVANWTRDREDQELLLDPLGALTRALYDDLIDYLYPPASGLLDLLGGRKNLSQAPFRVLIAIDSYEALDAGLHEWLLAHVLPGLKRVHPETGKRVSDLVDLRLLLCGREALREADPLRRWDALASQIRDVDLGRFSEAEIGAYLEARGLDPQAAKEAEAHTKGLPYLLALWCDSAGSHRAVAVARAANRVYWWKTPAQVRWLKAAAQSDTLDRDRLAVLLADPLEAHDAYAWLSANSEVAGQGTDGSLALHPLVRDLVCAGLAQESPADLAELRRRATIGEKACLLRSDIGPAAFGRLQVLARLKWFDAALLADIYQADGDALWRQAEAHVGGMVEQAPERDGALRLRQDIRDMLLDYQRLADASAFNDATARLQEAARRRGDAEASRNDALLRNAESRQSDASVARQRAVAAEARVASLQADERAAEDALKRAEQVVPDSNQVSRRAPWWAGSASALVAALAAFGSLPMLVQTERLYGWSAGSALLVLALGCVTRALWLPKPPSDLQIATARQAVDDTANRLARTRADLAQALLELSAAARLADQLQCEADTLFLEARQSQPNIL
jgi:hypothetical protein